MKKYKPGEHEIQSKNKIWKYESFLPSKINKQFIFDDPQLLVLQEDAGKSLGELNSFSDLAPGIELFIYMHVLVEANSSNRIEGAKTEIDDVLINEQDLHPEKKDDRKEVENYIKAMNFAIKSLDKLPVSMRLLNSVHKKLLSGVRGETKQPGKIRTTQNWIGGASINTAEFVPPHPDRLPELLTDLELFWHNDKIFIPELFKAAITHYQFETIHPYSDGNGRMGRLLIILNLLESKFLKKPVLYLSTYFEKNKNRYYEELTRVRETGNMSNWIKFFLQAVIETSKASKNKMEKLLQIKEKAETEILRLGRQSIKARIILEFLYEKPIIYLEEIEKILEIDKPAASRLVKKMVDIEILRGLPNKKRNNFWYFNDYISVFKE